MEKIHPRTRRLIISITYLAMSIAPILMCLFLISELQDDLHLGKFEILNVGRNEKEIYELTNNNMKNKESLEIIIRHNHIDNVKLSEFKLNNQQYIIGENAQYNKNINKEYDEIIVIYKPNRNEESIILNQVIIKEKKFLFFKRKFIFRNNDIIKIRFVGD